LNETPNGPFDEATVLADVIKKFRGVRNEIDEFAMALPRPGKDSPPVEVGQHNADDHDQHERAASSSRAT
jgi:hypothetical protein